MPPHLILGSMEKFDADVHCPFADCTGVDDPDSACVISRLVNTHTVIQVQHIQHHTRNGQVQKRGSDG